MAISPGYLSAINTGTQALYTTQTDGTGKTFFSPVASANLLVTSTAANIAGGNATITPNLTTGAITVTGNVTYLLTASAAVTNVIGQAPAPAQIQWYDNTAAVKIGSLAASGTPVVYTPTQTSVVVAQTGGGTYPAQLSSTQITVQVIDGF